MKGIPGPRHILGSAVAERIISEIVAAGSEGIFQNDVASRAGVDRITVYRVTKKYSNQKIIITRKLGRGTKYVAASMTYLNANTEAYMIGRNFLGDVLGKEDCILCKRPYLIHHKRLHAIDYEFVRCVDLSSYRDYFIPKFTQNTKLEKMLFEFSNQMGAYITFLFIQFMNPNNILLKLSSQEPGNTDKRNIIRGLVKNSISLTIPDMFDIFRRECLSRLRKDKPQNADGMTPSNFELDKKSVSNLSIAFANLYPFLNFSLVRIIESLPHTTNMPKQILDEYDELYRKQETCRHKWRNIKKGHVKQCIRCEKIRLTKI